VGDAEGVFLFNGATNSLTTIVRGDAVASSSGGTFDSITDDSLFLNTENQDVLVTFDSTGAISIVAQEGDAAPGGGVFSSGASLTFDDDEISANDSNQIVFQSSLFSSSFGSRIGDGIFYDLDTTSPGGVQSLIRSGDTITFGTTTAVVDDIDPDRSLQLNESGQFAFSATLETDSSANDNVLLIGDINNPGSFTLLAREGDPNINEAGQVLFAVSSLDDVEGSAIDSSIDSAIFFYDPTLGLLTAAREGFHF